MVNNETHYYIKVVGLDDFQQNYNSEVQNLNDIVLSNLKMSDKTGSPFGTDKEVLDYFNK